MESVRHAQCFLYVYHRQVASHFTPQPVRAVGVLLLPMVSGGAGGAGGWVLGKGLSGLYLRKRKVYKVDTW